MDAQQTDVDELKVVDWLYSEGMIDPTFNCNRFPDMEEEVMFKDRISRLSREAYIVVMVIFLSPKELIDFFHKHGKTDTIGINNLKGFFRIVCGWKSELIESVFRELKNIFVS